MKTGSTVQPAAVDVAAATLTVTVARSAIPELATSGQVFDQIGGTTGWYITNADFAGSFDATYVDQSAGCVAAA